MEMEPEMAMPASRQASTQDWKPARHLPQLLVVQTGTRQVCQNTAKSNAAQQQRLKLFHDGQVKQNTADCDHHQALPATLCGKAGKQCCKTGLVPQIQ